MADQDTPTEAPLKAKISLGVLQHFSAGLAVRLLAILSIAILGRLLTPADFGIFAYAVFVSTMIETCFFRHFHVTLIRLPEASDAHLHTLFTLRLITGLVLASAVAGSAAPVARWVEAPALEAVLYWMAIAQVIAAFASPRFMLLERAMRFGPAAFQIVLVRVITTCSAILLGFLVGNHWALVTGLVLMPIIVVAHSHWTAPYHPTLTLSKWRDFIAFGIWVTLSTLLNFLSQRIDRLVLGPALGVAAVGIYRMGVDLAELGSQQLAQPMERALYPGLAAKADDRSALTEAYIQTQAVVLGVVLPMGLLTALGASELLRIIAGPQWLGAAPVIWALAPLIALNTLEGGVRSLLYVGNDPRKLFFRNLTIFCVAVPAIGAGVALGGLSGVIIATVFVKLLTLVLTLRLADKETGKSFFAPFIRAQRSVVSAAAMTLAVLLMAQALPTVTSTSPVSVAAGVLVLKCGVGLGIYVAVHSGLWTFSGRPDGVESFALAMLKKVIWQFRRRVLKAERS